MATTVDQLIVEIKAETAGLRKGLDSVNNKLKQSNKTAKSSVMTFANLGKVFAAMGIAKLAGSIVGTARTFEDLNATLRAVTGSADGAALSMAAIENFTSGTTFQLENVSQAFVTLMNAGITPTSGVLKDFGNIAAAFGKDITTISQAVFNATTGETEMLKQFGIKAKLEGDKITMIFKEKETTIGRDSKSIVSYLRNIAQENYATALEERLNTVSGSFSNLNDMVSLVFKGIGEAGLNDALIKANKAMIEMVKNGIEPAAKVGMILNVVIGALGKIFQALVKTLGFVVGQMELLLAAMVGLAASAIVPVLASIGASFMKLKKAIEASSLAAIVFQSITLGPVGIAKVAAGVAAATAAYVLMQGEVEKLTKSMEDNGEVIDYNSMSTLELDEHLKSLSDSMKSDLTPAAKGVDIALGDMKDVVIQSSNAFTTDFVDSLLDGENALESFKNFSRNIVSQIIAIFMQMAVVNKILNAVFNLQGKDRLSEINLPNPDINNLADGIGFAGGGTIQKGQPTVVGERGAEIFVPNTGGSIMNNMNSKNAMGGGGNTIINQSINFATGVVPTVRAEVMKMMPQIADVTKGAVAEAAMRGGNYRRMLQGG